MTFLIMAQAETVNRDSFLTTQIELGESFTYSDGTYTALTFSPDSVSLSCNAIQNGSDGGIVIGPGNYTCNAEGVELNGTWNTTVVVNYTHQQANAAWNATTELRNATEDIPGWVPLIVIATIGALLLGLISMFRR